MTFTLDQLEQPHPDKPRRHALSPNELLEQTNGITVA